MLVGVDEAGRGPVLGSMFVAAVAVSDAAVLPERVGDSKELAPGVRRELASSIEEVAASIAIVEVTPREIDEDGNDMNRLTLAASGEAITRVLDGPTSHARVLADACDVSASRYRDRLARRVPDETTLDAFHGADGTEPIVGAASIVAKRAREEHVRKLRAEYGDVGSGYPSDPATRAFLTDYLERTGELPPPARRSWATCRDLLEAAAQESLAEF